MIKTLIKIMIIILSISIPITSCDILDGLIGNIEDNNQDNNDQNNDDQNDNDQNDNDQNDNDQNDNDIADTCDTLDGVSIGNSYSPTIENKVKSAISALTKHIQGSNTLSSNQIAQNKSTIESNVKYLGSSKDMILSSMNLIETYETTFGPFFRNEYTKNLNRSELGQDIHSTMLSVMQGVIDHVYISKIVNKCFTTLKRKKFISSEYFPGEVTSIPDPDEVHTAKINASYKKTFGHLIMHAELPARKPTGTYLAPGSIAIVTVPSSLVNKGYQIRIGAHSYDLSKKSKILRFDRSSIVYSINNTNTKVASPLGGGIYIEVPYLKNDGIVEIKIKNAVRSPYFSMKSFHTTTLSEWRNVERKHGAPWADFQTEKFMMQVPTSWIYKYDNPSALLTKWDKAVDAVSDLMGYPLVRGKEILYLQTDVIIRAGAYSPGYPQVNNVYKPDKEYNGNEDELFLTGPVEKWKGASMEFHENGHGHMFQKFPGETEAAVNVPYIAVLNRKFGINLEEAFWKSMRGGHEFKTMDNTAITWMVHEKFKLEKPMGSNEMKYQMRGYAKYVEVADLFGWEVLDAYWKSINQDYENTVSPQNTNPNEIGNYDKSINGLILRMSKKAGADLTPLIHFWGIHPNDIQAMKKAIEAANLKPSTKIYDKLVHYKSIVPASNQDFRNFILSWNQEQPASGTYNAQLWNSYDSSYASTVKAKVQKIIDLYFPNGRP